MKKSFLTFLLLTFCAISTNYAAAGETEAVPLKYIVTGKGINVRVDSTISSYSLGNLYRGEEVEIVSEKFDWYKIKLPLRFTCYLAKELTKKVDNENIMTIGSKINLRILPSLESPVLGKAPKGVIFPLIEKSGKWVKIQGYPYAQGWVHKKFLQAAASQTKLAWFVEQTVSKLSRPNMPEKLKLHQELIAKGERIIPLLQEYISLADKNTSYSIIFILTQFAKSDPSLVLYFLEKAGTSPVRAASIYLDAAQNIIIPDECGCKKTAYFYLAEKKELTEENIKKAVASLKKRHLKPEQKPAPKQNQVSNPAE